MKTGIFEIPGDRDPLMRGSHFGRYCRFMVAAQAAALIIILAALGLLAKRAAGIPQIAAFTADQRPFAGKSGTLGMTDTRFTVFVTDVVEGALTRTEAGLAPELSPYLTPIAEGKLRIQNNRAHPSNRHGFAQEFVVDAKDGIRVVKGNRFEARVMVRGVMTTKSPDGVAKNLFYWAAQFSAFPATADNPLGWRLTDLFEIGETTFYAQDLAKSAADAVKIPERNNR